MVEILSLGNINLSLLEKEFEKFHYDILPYQRTKS